MDSYLVLDNLSTQHSLQGEMERYFRFDIKLGQIRCLSTVHSEVLSSRNYVYGQDALYGPPPLPPVIVPTTSTAFVEAPLS